MHSHHFPELMRAMTIPEPKLVIRLTRSLYGKAHLDTRSAVAKKCAENGGDAAFAWASVNVAAHDSPACDSTVHFCAGACGALARYHSPEVYAVSSEMSEQRRLEVLRASMGRAMHLKSMD